MCALEGAGMLSSHNTKDSLNGGGRERQRNKQERFFVKLHKIKMNRKTKYFTQISIQFSCNCSFCITTAS